MEKAVALPDGVLESLLSESCDSEQVVCRLKESLQLDTASLKQPDSGTKQLIRCLARKAKCSKRLDVVKQLREITPAGTTGECVVYFKVTHDWQRWCSSVRITCMC